MRLLIVFFVCCSVLITGCIFSSEPAANPAPVPDSTSVAIDHVRTNDVPIAVDTLRPRETGKAEKTGKAHQSPPIVIYDTDGDGVKDELDKCPLEAGPASNNGCPVKPAPRGSSRRPSKKDTTLPNIDSIAVH